MKIWATGIFHHFMICDLFAGILTIKKLETFQAIYIVFGLHPPGHIAEKKNTAYFWPSSPPAYSQRAIFVFEIST